MKNKLPKFKLNRGILLSDKVLTAFFNIFVRLTI